MFDANYIDAWPVGESRYFTRIEDNHYRLARANRYSEELFSVDRWEWTLKADTVKASGRKVAANAEKLELQCFMAGVDRLRVALNELRQVSLNGWQQDARTLHTTMVEMLDLGKKPAVFYPVSSDGIEFPNT